MSVTLRHDIGPALANAIRDRDLMLLAVFGVESKSRWAGINKTNQYWACESFAIKLPTDVKHAWELLRVLWQTEGGASEQKGARVLAAKVWVSLGLAPQSPYLTAKPQDDEWAFLTAISAAPGELQTWGAYADWLQEREHKSLQHRGRVIAGWMGKKAMKVKYGVAWFPDEEKWHEVVKRYQSFQWDWANCILNHKSITAAK